MKKYIKLLGCFGLGLIITFCSVEGSGSGNGGGLPSIVQKLFLGIIGNIPEDESYVRIPEAAFNKKVGNAPFPMEDGVIGPRASRIPAILALSDGTVIITTDARQGSTADAAADIDIIFRSSTDNGANWGKAKYIFHWQDFKEGLSGRMNSSASFIDSSIVEDKNGDIVSMVTTFSARGGIQGGMRDPQLSPFYDDDGERYLVLTDTAEYAFEHEGDKDDYTKYKYRAHVEGGPITELDGTALSSDHSLYGYSIDKFWYLWKDGEIVKMKQANEWNNFPPTGKEIDAHVFYAAAPARAPRSSYAFMTRSKDKGKTWSKPVDTSWQWRPSAGDKVLATIANQNSSEGDKILQNYIVSPGMMHRVRGGQDKDRLLNVLYDVPHTSRYSNDKCKGWVIYSDNEGADWKLATTLDIAPPEGGDRVSESQIIQTLDNTLLMFARTAGDVGIAQSTDGGKTWEQSMRATGIPDGQWNGTMISAINLLGSVGANGEQLIALSHPDDAGGRRNGTVQIGVLKKLGSTWSVDFIKDNPNSDYATLVRLGNTADSFGYSAITELTNGNIGVYAERSTLDYTEIKLNRIEIQ